MTTITQKQLDDYKSLYPNDTRLQQLSLSELLANTNGGTVDWNSIQFPPESESSGTLKDGSPSLTDCQMNIGYVVFDAVCLAVGAVGLRASVSGTTIGAIFAAVAPMTSKLELVIAEIGAADSLAGKARGVFKILQTIWSGGSLGAVFSAFTASLTWYQAILYGATGMATIVAFMATDGLAFVAEVVILLGSFGFLAVDAANAVSACSIPEPTEYPDGTQIVDDSDGAIYLVLDSALRHFPDMPTYFNLYADETGLTPLPNVQDYLIGAPIAPGGAALITSDPVTDGKIYLLLEEGKRWITSQSVFARYYFDESKVQGIPVDQINEIPDGISLV